MCLTSEIALNTYQQRRQRLLQLAGDAALIIIPAAPERLRSRDSLYPYRQNSDFWYLTGFPEPDAILVLTAAGCGGRSILFCRPRDLAREAWDGPRIGPDAAPDAYAVDAAWPLDELETVLPPILAQHETVYCQKGMQPRLDALLVQCVNGAAILQEADPLLHAMRLVKDPEEFALMRKAAAISVNAHTRAMCAARPGMYEYELQAELEYIFTRHDAVPAYESIVGAGANGCILHYRANAAQIVQGDLVLIDGGCEYRGYAADITRTFPVNGRFSHEQRVLYDLVLAAQTAALDQARPGIAYAAIHEAAVAVLSEGLLRLGLITDAADYARFYPHKSGHWLGLDVHDVGDYSMAGASRPLQEGMVLTIEPGLYIPPGMPGVHCKWHGIGIRIEDDVLITADGHEVLTAQLARSADDVEALMHQD